jgi:hypothetical protein
VIRQLLLGSAMTVGNLAIQIWAVAVVVDLLQRQVGGGRYPKTLLGGIRPLAAVMSVLFLGHLLQFATWALLFVVLGEFDDFSTAFYHSAVNFTSLGYGDIVMSESRRLLGALEAANGVLMFGLTAGVVLSAMQHLAGHRSRVQPGAEGAERDTTVPR